MPCHLVRRGSSSKCAAALAQGGAAAIAVAARRTLRAPTRALRVSAATSNGSSSSSQPDEHAAPALSALEPSAVASSSIGTDPEVNRTYVKQFGKRYAIDLTDVIEYAPQIRVRRARDRQRDQLAELAVLNERLAGHDYVSSRKRVEYLKAKRRNWEAIYNYITRSEAAATLAVIEEANAKVDSLLSAEAQEVVAVGELRNQLQQLQGQVEEAQERLSATQTRVQRNLERVEQLKKQAATLEELNKASVDPVAAAAASAARAVEFEVPAAAAASTVPPNFVDSAQEARTRSNALAGPSAVAASSEAKKRRKRGLVSSLSLEEGLRNYWYPAAFVKDLVPDMMIPFEMFGETWVMFRDENGAPSCIRDECAHRACPLSLGKVVDGKVECAYHGWQFNGAGDCEKMPSTTFCRGVHVSALPVVERDGFVWVWPGDLLPTDVPPVTAPPEGYKIHAEIEVEVPVEHGLLVENLLDLAHAPFTHTTTFAKGWPVPDSVRFHASKLLGGNWDPYPIDMAFHPPCMTASLIGLAQPGKVEKGARALECKNHLHQLHVCLPSREGHTRLLYRMSMDFMDWVQYVPGIQRFWKYIAGQVLGEDLVLVLGQQDRLLRGGDTWGFPVSYDKLGVRYRRWRNNVSRAGVYDELPGKTSATMSAGQLFSLDEEDDDALSTDFQAAQAMRQEEEEAEAAAAEVQPARMEKVVVGVQQQQE